MKTTLPALILTLILYSGAYAAVEPVITVNSMSGTANPASGSPVTVSVKLSPGEKEGADADWWLVGNAFGRWYYCTPDAQWTDIGETLDITKLRPVYQGRLFTLPQTDILHVPGLQAGIYTLYFGIDLNMNGKPDADSLVFGEVRVVMGSPSDFVTAVSGAYTYTLAEPLSSSSVSGEQKIGKTGWESENTEIMPTILHFIPLQNGYGIQVQANNTKQLTLKTVPLSDPENGRAISEIVLENNSVYYGMFANGNRIYWAYRVPDKENICRTLIGFKVIDFSEPETPVIRGSIEVEDNHYYMDPMVFGAPICFDNYYGKVLQMNGDILILTYSAGYYASIMNKIKILDFSDPDRPNQIAELRFDDMYAFNYFLNGNMLYFSQSKNIEYKQSKHYLGRIDLSNPAVPVRLPSVNIPGTCVGTDGSGNYIFTVNPEWEGEGKLVYTFNSVKLDADKAYLTDKIKFGNYVSQSVVSDGLAYLFHANNVILVDIGNPENLKAYQSSLKDTLTTIMGVKNRKIFAKTSAGVVCYDASDPANLGLDEYVGHYSYSDRIAFSGNKVYVPLGYYGVWVKSLNNE